MKNLFTKYGIMILSLAALIAVLLSVMTYFATSSAPLPDLAGIIASPFRAASAAVAGKVGGWMDYLTEFDRLKEENEALKLQIAEMEEAVRQAELDRDENQRLREVAELRQQRRDLTLESARVVEQDVYNWESLLTVDKGTSCGVEVGDCVVTEAGYLVGVVTEAGYNWSTIRTVIDSESSIGASVFRSGASALAQGDFALMNDGLLTLGYLGTDPNVVAGDLVVTSGLGGYYPSRLPIGYVTQVRTGDDGLAQYAVVRPAADLSGLVQVFIVKDFTIVD